MYFHNKREVEIFSGSMHYQTSFQVLNNWLGIVLHNNQHSKKKVQEKQIAAAAVEWVHGGRLHSCISVLQDNHSK